MKSLASVLTAFGMVAFIAGSTNAGVATPELSVDLSHAQQLASSFQTAAPASDTPIQLAGRCHRGYGGGGYYYAPRPVYRSYYRGGYYGRGYGHGYGHGGYRHGHRGHRGYGYGGSGFGLYIGF